MKRRIVYALAAIATVMAGAATYAVVTGNRTPKGPNGRDWISPNGAPYGYELPGHGWIHAVQDGTGHGGKPPAYLTSVGTPLGNGNSDAVVSVEVMHDNTSPTHRNIYQTAKEQGPQGFSTPDGWTMNYTTINTGPAWQVEYHSKSGGAGGRYYFLANSPAWVMCQWLKETSAQESLRGCAEVVATLEITP